MFLAFLASATPIFAAPTPAPGDWRLRPVSSLHKLTARQPGVLEPFVVTPAQLHAARGEWECFQIVIQAGNKPLRNLRVEPTMPATHLGQFIARENVRVFRQNYVLVDHPSGNRRLDKVWWPDALIPLENQALPDIAANQSLSLWCAIKVPQNAEVGQYFGAIDVYSNRAAKSLVVILDVSSRQMPPPTLRANVALYYDMLRDWYLKSGRPFSAADWTKQKKRFYEFLLDYRLNAYDLPVDWQSDEANRYLNHPAVLSVRLPALDAPDFAAAVDRLKRTGTLRKAYYYHIDEPGPDRYEQVRATTKRLRAIDPQLRHCVTIHPNTSLQGAVDIWCPNIGDATGLGYLDLKMLADERRRGRETWWYTMVEPKYPYPTWLLDDDAGAVRVYGRLMAQNGISGFVYSMAHGWGPQPLRDVRSFEGTNGDGTLLYPAELAGGIGPMPSIRLMLLRDAIEDYELLRGAPASFKKRWLNLWVELTPFEQRFSQADDLTWTQRDAAHEFFNGWRKELLGEVKPASVDAAVRSSGFIQLEPARPIPFAGKVRIDGQLQPAEWTQRQLAQRSLQTIPDFTRVDFRRFESDTHTWPETSWYLARDGKYLYVAARARQNARGDWFAIEIAPLDGIKWRFVATAAGKTVVEKSTREGRFQIADVDYQAAATMREGFTDYEMKIPLSILGGASQFRLNALRRTIDANSGTRVILRAWPDGGDVRRMPLVTIAATALK